MAPSHPDLTAIDVAFVFSLASAAGALFIIMNWIFNRQGQRLFFLRLIVFLSLANLLSSIAYIMSFVKWRALMDRARDDGFTRTYCLVQGSVMVFAESASVIWTVLIALALHQQVVRRAAADRHECYYHLIAWGVPLAMSVALLLAHRLGPADEPRETWCWIASNSSEPPGNHTPSDPVPGPTDAVARTHLISGAGEDSRWVQLVVFYVPLALAFAFNLGTYIRVGGAFRRMAREGAVDAAKERMIQLRLRMYLLVFILVWALPLAHRSLQLAGYHMEWLRIAHTATQCSMGWLNCLVYGCNEATLRPYRDALSSLSCSLFNGLQLSRLTRRGAGPGRYDTYGSCGGLAEASAAMLGGGQTSAMRPGNQALDHSQVVDTTVPVEPLPGQ